MSCIKLETLYDAWNFFDRHTYCVVLLYTQRNNHCIKIERITLCDKHIKAKAEPRSGNYIHLSTVPLTILRTGASNQLFQLTHIRHFRATKHRRPCTYGELPFGDEQMVQHPIKTRRFYETSSKLRQPKWKSLPKDFFLFLPQRQG